MSSVILQIPGIPGGPEVLLILLLAVLLFGANKIPKLARSTGQAMGEFQKGREQVEQELEEMKGTGDDEAERATDDDEVQAVGTETTDADRTSSTDTERSTDTSSNN